MNHGGRRRAMAGMVTHSRLRCAETLANQDHRMVLSARGGHVRGSGSDGMPYGSQQTPLCGVLFTSNFVLLDFGYGSFVRQQILQSESFYLEDTGLGEKRVGEY